MFQPNAQLPLLDWPFEPIRLDRLHYVPVLIDLPGELMALEHADTLVWERMTPLLQVVPRDPKAGQKPGWTVSRAKRIAQAVGYHPFYLDTSGAVLGKQGRGGWPESVVAEFHDRCRREMLAFVPVHTVGRRDLAGVVAAAVAQDGRGAAIRLMAGATVPLAALSLAETLESELTLIETTVTQTDLIIDFGYPEPRAWPSVDEVSWLLDQAGRVGAWRNTILAATSIPRTMGAIREGTIGPIDRREWRLWSETNAGRSASVAFADYGIQSPRAPSSGGGSANNMRANIRYSGPGETLVARNVGAVYSLQPAERRDQYRELCTWLMHHPQFGGRRHCWGDDVIEGCAEGTIVPGTQNLWRGVGMSHHFQETASALQRLVVVDQTLSPAAARLPRVAARGVGETRSGRRPLPGRQSPTPAGPSVSRRRTEP